jgi:hemoglobin-like flavoprotein
MKEADLVSRSYGRCLVMGNVLFDRFYDYFLASDPRIAPMFRNTEMKIQKKLLRAGINYVIMYCTEAGQPAGQLALGRIRNSHSQEHLNIEPELYPLWIDSLLKAIAEVDPKFSPVIKSAWTKVLGISVGFIRSGYSEHATKPYR